MLNHKLESALLLTTIIIGSFCMQQFSALTKANAENTPIPGDLDSDGAVNASDLNILASAYGSTPNDARWNPGADINNDSKVGLPDLVIMAASYGKTVEGYYVLKAAFHIHTTYSNGTYTPAEVVDLYKFSGFGFNVISVTDYNSIDGSFAGVAEARAEGQRVGMIVIGGQEIISQFPQNNGSTVFKHILALFLTQPIPNPYSTYRTNEVQWYFDAIHNQSGIGIVAHSWGMNDQTVTGTSASPWWQFRNASYIDGWEIFNYGMMGNGMTDDEISTVLDNGKIPIASHDFHHAAITNSTYNLLFCNNKTEEGVKDALLNRRIVVCNYGKVYGAINATNLYHQLYG
jgi:hypothetical protein